MKYHVIYWTGSKLHTESFDDLKTASSWAEKNGDCCVIVYGQIEEINN